MDETENNVKEGSSQFPSKGSLNSNNNNPLQSVEDLEMVNLYSIFSYGQTVEAGLPMMSDDQSDFAVEGEGSIQEKGHNDVEVSTGRLKKKCLQDANLEEDLFRPIDAEFEDLVGGSDGFFYPLPVSFEPETSSDSSTAWDLEFFGGQDEFNKVWGSGLEESKSGVADGLQDSVVEPVDPVVDEVSRLSLR